MKLGPDELPIPEVEQYSRMDKITQIIISDGRVYKDFEDGWVRLDYSRRVMELYDDLTAPEALDLLEKAVDRIPYDPNSHFWNG